jgi:hypothetical protein
MPIVRLDNLQQFAAVNVLSDPGAIAGPKLVPQCAQVVLVWGLDDGKLGHNVLYGRYTGSFAITLAQINGILTALTSGGAWTALAAFLSTTSSLAAVTVRNVHIADQPIVPSTVPAANGSSASPALPAETAAVITLRTALVGPANRGRVYVPGWATNSLGTGNIIAATAVTALQNWANTIPGVLSGAGLTWVIGQPARQAYTGTSGRQHPARAATSQPITSQSIKDNHWDSQRRRGLK